MGNHGSCTVKKLSLMKIEAEKITSCSFIEAHSFVRLKHYLTHACGIDWQRGGRRGPTAGNTKVEPLLGSGSRLT